MDFSFSVEQESLRNRWKRFVDEEVRPRAAEADKNHRLDPELIKMAQELGLFGTFYPREYGGAGLGFVGLCLMLEELARGCGSFALMFAAHQGIGAMGIYLEGTAEQKKKYLVPLVKGEKISACAVTEPDSGSDITNLKTRADFQGDHFVINGTKRFITNGDIADIIVMFASTGKDKSGRSRMTSFILEKDFPGFSVRKIEDKMGITASGTAELVFNNMIVPAENVLGKVGEGYKVARKTLELGGRVTLGAMCLGAAKELIDLSLAHAKKRVQFGKPIQNFQTVQGMLGEMATRTFAMESVVYRVARLLDRGEPSTMEAAICKLFSSEAIDVIAELAMRIHGGTGCLAEYPIERFYRDARINRLYEGTSEIQKIIIAASLIKKGVY